MSDEMLKDAAEFAKGFVQGLFVIALCGAASVVKECDGTLVLPGPESKANAVDQGGQLDDVRSQVLVGAHEAEDAIDAGNDAFGGVGELLVGKDAQVEAEDVGGAELHE